jgi:hypothetical protein
VGKLCHNCDTKPVSTAKTDFIDRMGLLILRKLLKTKATRRFVPADQIVFLTSLERSESFLYFFIRPNLLFLTIVPAGPMRQYLSAEACGIS